MSKPTTKPRPPRPNFLIIVADDLGYSDIGPFGSEIATPNLDRLAREGVRLTNFHTASACSPTRSMLLSGTDSHIAGLGQMEEQIRQRPEIYKDKPGYEGYLNWRVAALSEVLQDAGYHTVMSGKWHLGLRKDLAPCSRGFARNFSFLPGAGNHFNYEPQLDSDCPLLPFIWTDGFWMEGEEHIDRKTQLPADFYSTTSFTDRLLDYLAEHESDPTCSEQPFFAYLPFTAPHWPLQAPKETREKYKGRYDEGPTALRENRLRRMAELGIISADVKPAPVVGLKGREWEDLDASERAISARKMETYAAMVDEIDKGIGRILDHLQASGKLDNTMILFMSDNGAEGKLLEAIPMMGSSTNLGQIVNRFYNNSLDNIGNFDSFTWYGPRWACAATAPSRGFKTWITEGGIRCPCIVRYPSSLKAPPAAISNAFTTVMDIFPTVLDLAGVPHPPSQFRGRVVAPIRGKSWLSHLRSEAVVTEKVGVGQQPTIVLPGEIHDPSTTFTGWELFGSCAIRRGDWKAAHQPPPRGKGDWELYNVEKDPGELEDLAETKPEILKGLITDWEQYYAETGMFDTKTEFNVIKG